MPDLSWPGQPPSLGFSDPSHAIGTEEEILADFRRVRDQIRLVFEAYAAGYREAAAKGKGVDGTTAHVSDS